LPGSGALKGGVWTRLRIKKGLTMHGRKNMESWNFSYNSKTYRIEYYSENSHEIKLFSVINGDEVHLKWKQKPLIVEILEKIIKNDNRMFNSNIINYIENVYQQNHSNTSQNTRSLGKVLFKYLRDNDIGNI
jgi:hypothetical protein